MKNKNKWMLGALLIGALASCEMKDELTGTTTSSQEMGALELDLSVLEPGSRAINLADQFPVHITCPDDLDNPEKNKEFSSYSSMENPVQLPVGDYIVSANTAGEIFPIMTAPYYKGSEPLIISAGSTEQVEVVCKMANTKIKLDLPEDFKTFQSWTILFDDGTENTLTFGTNDDADGDGSSALYWYLGETGAPTIIMNITATTSKGVEVSQSETFSKSDVEESYEDDENNFVGGDALNIKIDVTDEPIDPNPDEPEETKPEISFGVTVDATFNNTNESVTIPVTPGVSGGGETSGGETGGDDEEEGSLSMQMPSNGHITYTLGGSDQPASADVVITAPNGIKSMNVKIVAGNEGFETTISDLSGVGLDFVTNGVELVGNEVISGVLGAFLGEGASVEAPQAGDVSYKFPVGAFFTLMNGFGATAPNAHTFKIVLEDQAGNKIDDELSVTINPAA